MTNDAEKPANHAPRPGVLAGLKRLLFGMFTYAFLIAAGGLLAVLSSYLMRQFGY
ncbi:MAG: hypothetical protein IT178_14755 [Acidobacteria bacterium]|nr:hypothetical protein [Acidobacteriota bacterium]